jgi:hypothetical protein
MTHRSNLRYCVLAVMFAVPVVLGAQASQRPPRLFSTFAGTWALDPDAGRGHITGLPVAGTLVISTSPTAITVVKDSRAPETYRFDNREADLPGGAVANFHFSFALVADALALTTRRTRSDRGHAFTNIITDAYAVRGDVLTIERQLSVLVEPPGNLVTLQDENNNRQTFVYRRVAAAASAR